MSVNLTSDESLHAALRPYRVDTAAFEAAVRQRLEAASVQRQNDPVARLPPFLRCAASVLPLPLLTGGKLSGAAAGLAPAAGGYKLLAYLALPAISLFVLLGAAVFSILKIRSIQQGNLADADLAATRQAVDAWWRRYRPIGIAILGATVILPILGLTWVLFVAYVISFGLLLLMLSSFARIGLGNRVVIGQSCLTGLVFLMQVAGIASGADNSIHFFNQSLLIAIFGGGVLILLAILSVSSWRAARPIDGIKYWSLRVLAAAAIFFLVWLVSPSFRSATPAQIKNHVESFDKAPYSSASWSDWEFPARWAVESGLNPDLTGPRRLLVEEIAGEQNPFVLGSAFRVGLVESQQLEQLATLNRRLASLIHGPIFENEPISSVQQFDWVIRAAVQADRLSATQRDDLASRLRATLDYEAHLSIAELKPLLRVTRLLDVIDRPIDRNQVRPMMHDRLREFHSLGSGGFQPAGGFKAYSNSDTGSMDATACAVELMEIYGIPDGLDLNWVRSYLRPSLTASPDRWIAAVTLDRLNRLPDATRPNWVDYCYYERSLMAAVVLVGLCIYATLLSPMPKATADVPVTLVNDPSPIA